MSPCSRGRRARTSPAPSRSPTSCASIPSDSHGGPDMAPKPPKRSSRPGGAVALLGNARGQGAPTWPPSPQSSSRPGGAVALLGNARGQGAPTWPPTPKRSSRPGGAVALLGSARGQGAPTWPPSPQTFATPRRQSAGHEGVAGEPEAQRQVGRARDADSRAGGDLPPPWLGRGLDGQGPSREVGTVVAQRDGERPGEIAGPGGQAGSVGSHAAPSRHRRQPRQRLQRPDPHAAPRARRSGDRVQA